jgi:hypothetical protein
LRSGGGGGFIFELVLYIAAKNTLKRLSGAEFFFVYKECF